MTMIKQSVALVVLSIAVVLAMSYAQHGIQALLQAHEWVSQMLTDVFSGGQAGSFVRGLIALLAIPFFIASIPTLIYWLIRKRFFPYFIEVVWVVWLLQAGALLVFKMTA